MTLANSEISYITPDLRRFIMSTLCASPDNPKMNAATGLVVNLTITALGFGPDKKRIPITLQVIERTS